MVVQVCFNEVGDCIFVNIVLFVLDQQQQTLSTRAYVESTGYDAKALFEKIFYKDIIYLKKMEALWDKRKAPKELIYKKISSGESKFEDSLSNGTESSDSNFVIRDQKKWSMDECLEVFRTSLAKLKTRLLEEHVLEWDKDDDMAVDFVTSVSNFRSYCFSIDRKSKFEVKSLAGNIIPAISTTNTIVGGFIILEVIRLLSNILPERIWKNPEVDIAKLDVEKLKSEATALKKNIFWGYVSNKNAKNFSKVYIEGIREPRKDCFVCSSDIKEIVVALPLPKTTLGDFVNEVVKKKFKTIAPDISVLNTSIMLWAADEEDDEDEDVNESIRGKLLSSYAFMKDGVTLSLKDLEQNFEVHMLIRDVEFDPEENDGEFYKVCNQSELDNIITDTLKNSTAEIESSNGGPIASTSNATTEKMLINIEEDDFVCLEDEERVAHVPAVAVMPNDDDFAIIEMSELDEINMETLKATNKRPIGGDDLIILEDESTSQNGNSSENNTPTKRIRTN